MSNSTRSIVVSLLLVIAMVSTVAKGQRILPTSFISPYDPGWEQIISVGAQTIPFVLINPNSGPGPSANDGLVAAFRAVVNRCKAAGIKTLGYVDSSYARIPIDTVLTGMTRYREWYGIDGFFIDQATSSCNDIPYYQRVYNLAKQYSANATVTLNFGTQVPECFASVSDILLTAEQNWQVYSSDLWTPEWVWRYPAERFYHIAYGVTDGMLPAAFNLARNRHAGLVYFTELGLPNPYGKLASHFSRQVRLVQG